MPGIAEVAKKAEVTAEQAQSVLAAIKSIAARESVIIQGFGTFKTVTKAARMAPNPQKKGEKIAVPARKAFTFKPAKPKKAQK